MVTKVFQPATYESSWDTHVAAVRTYINNNPGTDQATIQTGTSKSKAVVDGVLDFLILAEQVVQKDDAGTPRYWGPGDWADDTFAEIANLETHIASNDGDNISNIATALSITEAEAEHVAYMAELAAKAKIVEKD